MGTIAIADRSSAVTSTYVTPVAAATEHWNAQLAIPLRSLLLFRLLLDVRLPSSPPLFCSSSLPLALPLSMYPEYY